MPDMSEVQRLFEELAETLSALRAHAKDPDKNACLESAEQRARRGAELASRAARARQT